MKSKSTFLRVFALLALMLPWALQAQNAKVSEYDYEVTTATYTSIASTGIAWTETDVSAGYVDVDLPFAMQFGETSVPSGSTLRIYGNGSVQFTDVTALSDSRIAPLYYSSGYGVNATSVHYTTSTSEVVVEWRKVSSGNNSYSFQLKMASNGNIKFCYGPMTTNTSISVIVGMMSSTSDIYRVGGANGTSSWDDITRYTSGATTTRTLSNTYKPAYDAVAGTGTVYTFTQPACVKPNTFTATAASSSTVNLAWTLNDAGVKYEIKYSTNEDFDPDTEGTQQWVNDATALSASVTSLSANTTYYFALRKYCDANTPSGWIKASATTDCAPYTAADLPIVEDFDSYSTGTTASIHRCWTKVYGYSGSHTSYPYPYSTYKHSGSNSLYFYSSTTASYRSWVAIPYSGPMNNIAVNFWIYKTSAAYGNIQVGVMSDPDDFSTFELIANAGINGADYSNSTWYNQEVYFDGYTGNGTYIVLLAPSGAFNYAYIDDITISTIPACRRVSNVQCTLSGLVSWSAISGATFEVKYATADFDPTIEGTANTVSTNTFQIPSPEASTTYYVYVRNSCNDYWKKVSFTTPLMPPYSQDFTSTTFPPAGWARYTGLISSAYSGTNPTSATSGWLRTTSSYGLASSSPFVRANIFGTGFRNWLTMPNIYIPANNYNLSFDIALTGYSSGGNSAAGAAPDDKFIVIVSTDGGNTWSQANVLREWNNTGSDYVYDNISRYGESVEISLAAYAGQSVMIAFYGESTTSNGDNYFYIDNVLVDVVRNCAKPTALTASNITGSSATVSWTENSPTPATQWLLKYSNTSFDPATDNVTTVTVNSNPTHSLTGLTPGTTYYYAVQALCSADDESLWSTVSSFTTSFGVPFYEDFSTTTFPPTGWTRLTGLVNNAFDGTNPTSYTSGWFRATTSYGLTTQPFARGNIYGSSWKHWLVTPNISIDVNAALEFDIALTGYSSSGNSDAQTTGSDDRFVVLVSTDNGATWSQSNVLREWNNSGSDYAYNDISRYGTHVVLPLSAYQGQSVMIAFYGESTVFNADNFFYIDNVSIQQIVSCYPVNNVATSNITATTVDLSWSDNNGTPDSWTVIYGAPGFDPTTAGTSVTATTNPFTLTGLTAQTSYDVYVRANCVTGSDVSALSSVCSFATTCTNPCYDSIYMYDSHGDGWEGHTIDMYVNGVLQSQYTLASGSEGSAIVQMCPNDQVQFIWHQNGRTMYGENSFEIYNHDNDLISSISMESGLSDGLLLWSGRACFTPNCHTPNNLTASNITYTSATVDWTETTTPAPTQWVLAYGSDADNMTEVAVNTKPYTITGLTANTTYYYKVRAVCDPGVDSSDWSLNASLYTGYCIPAPSSVDNNGMINVAFGDALTVNTDTTNGLTYGDFTNLIGDAGQGTSAEVVIDYATGYTYGTIIWVDWNNDLDFDDEGEQVYYGLSESTNPTTLTASFTIPATAALGDYRMRIGGSDNNLGPDPCYTGTYACLFDFTLRVTPAPSCYKPTALAASNVYGKQATLSWNENTPTAATQWQLCYTANGETTYKYVNTNNNYLLTGLSPETEYTNVMVRSICGAGDTSNWSTPISFTTTASCFAPTALTAVPTVNSAFLSWTENTMPTAATSWQLAYGSVGFDPDNEVEATYVETTINDGFELTGLRHSTAYQVVVRSSCGDDGYSNWSSRCNFTTNCGTWTYADMPLVENFDGYTGTTLTSVASHILPNCWSYINVGTSYLGLPTIYSTASYAHSTPNSLRFDTYYTAAYADQYAILPQFGFDLDTLEISFYGRFYNASSTIEVGVMTDPTDVETFEAVETLTAPSTGYSTQQPYAVSLSEYTGSARYVAFRLPKPTSGDNAFYMDDLTVKLREKVNTLSNNGDTLAICNEVVIPDTANNNYANNINATYVINPAEAGKVAHLTGSYNLEYGYDFLNVYRGAVSEANLVGRYTGTGNIDYVTTSNNWVDSGYFTLVFTTDDDNALDYDGFKLLVSCECPSIAPEVEEIAETANGTYTWTAPAGNGRTYTHNVVRNGLTYGVPEETVDDIVNTYNYIQTNVAGCDSVEKAMTLTLHPTYSKTYNAEICQNETFSFYGQEFTEGGTHTVSLTSQYGADSTGILNLQVHPLPTVAINYNGRAVTTVTDFCDNADMALLARSNTTGATFVWDDESTDANRVVNPHESNTYTVVATEPTYGCSSLTATLTVTTTPVPELSITATEATICRGESTTLTLTDANDVDATYTWSNAMTGTSITVTPTETTTYTATATTTTGACVATAEYTVTVNQLPVVTATTSTNTICSDSIITLTATNVDGYSYLWNTGAATATATTVAAATADYTVIVTDANGCIDSFTTAVVTVNTSYERDVDMDVCYTQNPYTWGQQTITADGNYDQMFTAKNGCDSLIHLTFAFQQMSVFNTPMEVCEGTVLTWGPQTVTAAVDTTISYVLNAGDTDPDNNVLDCPAQYNLILTVNHPAASSFERTVCDSTVWNVSGLTYTESGAYPYTLATVKGCDSVVTMNLTVNYHVYNEYTVEHACDSYTWNTETYTEPGDYVQSFDGYLCDSTRTLHLLVVDTTTYGTDNILYCGDTASWIAGNTAYQWIDGSSYTMSETDGNITYNLQGQNQYGCDSIATLNLVLNPVYEVLNWVFDTACDEYAIDTISCDGVRGTKYINQSGDYWLRTPTAVEGREVLTRIHLTVNRSTYHTTVVTACVPYEWKVVIGHDEENDEDIYYSVGTYNEDSYVSYQMPDQYSANGCNRIEVLRLTALMPTEETIEATICQNGSWTSPDESVIINGSDLEIGENNPIVWNRTTNDAGCNYDQKVALTVNPVYDTTAVLTFCENEFVDNQYILANALNADDSSVVLTIEGALNETSYSNTVVANWHTQNGCDSTVTITYTVNPTTYETVTVNTCYRYLWEANGETYDESGEYTYTDQGANSYRCDNVMTLNLTINDSIVDFETVYHCSDYEYEGVTYRTTQTFREELDRTEYGCEHIRYVTHQIIPTQMTDLYVVTNMPYTWQNGVTYTESIEPVYFETTTLAYANTIGSEASTSCDSILVLHLTIVNDTAEFCENALPYDYTAMGITLDGTTTSRGEWTRTFDFDQMEIAGYPFFGTATEGQWTQWRTRFFPGQHDGMHTVNGTEVANRESEYITVDLVVNGETRATKTLHNLPSLYWINISFDTPVRINDSDTVDFVYTAESAYAVYLVSNTNGIQHPENYQIRYCPTCEWYNIGQYDDDDDVLYLSINGWYNFGIDDGYYYISNSEDHHDTILYYIVNSNHTESISETACDSYTWTAGTGATYTESGEYTYQTTTVNGCDSVVTLTLTVNQNSSSMLDAVAACDSYTWYDSTYTMSGNYTHTYIDANGCQSVDTLPLTINNSVIVTLDSVTACDSYTWTYNDVTVGTYTESGNQVYTWVDANECNDTAVLPLTINASTNRDETVVVNAASTYRNGNYYAASDTPYTFDEYGTNAAGCPDTVHISLIVHQGETEDVEVNACGEYTWATTDNGNGHTYQWISTAERQANGNALYKDITDPANPIYIHNGENPTSAIFNEDGTVDTTYVLWLNLSEAGYESVDLGTILLSQHSSLTVNGANDSLDTQTIDLSEYIAAEQDATLNVQVLHNSPSSWYCGNLVTYTANLVWNYDTVEATVCDVTTYNWSDADVTFDVATGDDNYYTYTFNAGTDTEQVTTMHVTVNARTASDPQEVSNCFTYTWTDGDGETYTESGTYYWNDDANCTRETLDLTIFENSSYSLPAVVECDSYTWTFNDVEVGTYTTSGDCTFDITDANGCAATVTLPLTINVNHGRTQAVTACDSYTWNANDGETYTLDSTQVKTVTYTDANGCEGTDVLTLTINSSNTGTDVLTACGSLEWIDGVTYTDSNTTATYTIVNGNAGGCDSTVTLNLTVYHPQVFAREQYAYGNGITINGQFYTAPDTGVATYNVVLDTVDPDANDCPTVVNVTLYVSQYEYYYTNYVACGEYTWETDNNGNGHVYRGLTDAEADANPTALYYDVTAEEFVTANPMNYDGNHIYVLNLTINNPSVTNITRTVLMSQLETGHTLTLEGNVEDFSTEYAAEQDTTVTRSYSLGAHYTCDSIVNYTINLVWNYDTVNATVCDVDSYTWETVNETFDVTTGDNYYTHVFNAGTETEQVTTMKVTVLARTEAPQTPVAACDSYTWHDSVYTASDNLEYNNDENCTHETLALTINSNAGLEETSVQCHTYTWEVATYELDETTGNYVAADPISNTYTEGGEKTVTFIDANGCEGTATLNLTIYADSSETLDSVIVCDSYTWTYNGNEVGTYTEGGDKTYEWTDVNGCATTATLPLTVNYSQSVSEDIWMGEGSYRYTGIHTTATAQMLTASSTPYQFTETVEGVTADGCDSIYNISLHVGNAFYATETFRSCNSFTWERNNHTYVRLTDEQAAANPTALYYDETDDALVIYNPTVNIPNEGTYDSVFMLQLTLDAIWSQTDVIDFPVSEGTITYHGRNYDFSMTDDEGRVFADSTVVDTVNFEAATYCDSIYYVTFNIYNNYREVATADICASTESYTWRGQTISTVTTEYDSEHTYYIYDTINDNDSVQYITITQHPVHYATVRRTACGSYTWYDSTYTSSTSNETHMTQDQYGCDSIVTLTLTINPVYDLVDDVVACDSYTWEGETYTESTQEVKYYTTDKGCDSTMTLNLTVNYNTNTTVTVDECDSYTWHGTEYTESGAYRYDYTAENDCPSIDSLYLTIRNNSDTTINNVVCDSYTWYDSTYTVSGTYTYEYTAANGCPSVNTLNLTVNYNSGHKDVQVACDSIEWHDTWYYADNNTATYNYTDDNECASIDTLNLTINVNAGSVTNVAECQSYTWTEGTGMTYTESGVYTNPVIDANGCNGNDTLNLTIGSMRVFVNQEVINCGAYTWIVNDSTLGVFNESTNASVNLPNSLTGCDSVVILTLTVNPLNITEETICDNVSYTWDVNDETYTEAGTYTDITLDDNGNCLSENRLVLTVTQTIHTALTDRICLGLDYTANGFNIAAAEMDTAGEYHFTRTETNATTNCDEVFELTLTVGNILNNNVDAVTACDSYSWTAGDGQTYELTATGSYESQPYANDNGCTTIDVLPLTILINEGSEETQVACVSYTWDVNGETYTESGDYTATITDDNNCNGTATLHLTIGSSEGTVSSVTACDTYTWNGATYTTTGDYTYATTNADGCAAVDTLHLTVNYNSSTAYTETACTSYDWNGITYTQNGTFYHHYNNADGCASIDTLVLTINAISEATVTETACDSYTWIDDVTYTASTNTPTVTLTAANGCDSIVTLNLTVNHSSSNNETITACDSYTWNANGETYTTSGIQTYEYTSAEGCPSVDSLFLTVNAGTTSSFDAITCNTYTWNGTEYSVTGAYAQTFTAANGCDSVVTMNLTVSPAAQINVYETTCGSYTWDNDVYTTSGIYTHNYTATNGCDSIVNLMLTINAPITNTVTATACDSYTWIDDVTYTASTNTPSITLTAANGCDSIITLNLTVNNSASSSFDETVCNSYTWNGATYTTSGAYTHTYTAANGCDSVVTLNLTISPAISTTIFRTSCGSYTWEGTTYTTSGVYNHTYTASTGCDSVVTLTLTIKNPVTSTVTVTECDSYSWNGLGYTTSGNYTHTYTAANGCDSVVTLNLTVNYSATSSFSETVCGSYTWNGASYTTSGAYTHTYTTVGGCDSVVTLNLTISPAITNTVSVSACNSYIWNGITYSVSGSYTHTYTAASGCDSIVTLNLTILPSITTNVTETACDSYTWDGTTYTTSGIYTNNYTSADGCDSLVNLALTITNSINTTLAESACDSYTWDGTEYTTSGIYTETFTSVNGCDSTVTLNLTINASTASTDQQTACESYTWIDGETYTTSTDTPTVTLTNAAGCDSVITLNLTVNYTTYGIDEQVACDGFIWIDGNNYTESTMTPVDTITGSNGCDSIVTLHLTINNSVEVYETITVNSTELPYTWRGETIPGAGDYVFNAYTVNGCDSTVYLHVNVNQIGIDVVSFDDLKVYPNPTHGQVTISADEVVKVEVLDIVGRKVATFENTNTFDLSNLAEGAYTLRITLPEGVTVRKIVKR